MNEIQKVMIYVNHYNRIIAEKAFLLSIAAN